MAENNLPVIKAGAPGTASPLGDLTIPLREPDGVNYTIPGSHDCYETFRDLGLLHRGDHFEVRALYGVECDAAHKCELVVRGWSYTFLF